MTAGNDFNSGAIQIRYGGFWLRFGALNIDLIPFLIIDTVAEKYKVSLPLPGYDEVFIAAFLAYFVLFEASPLQGTPGKWLYGLRVSDSQGMRIHWIRALARTISKLISFIPLALGFLMAAFMPKKQTLHDLIAKTYVQVVVTRPKYSLIVVFYVSIMIISFLCNNMK